MHDEHFSEFNLFENFFIQFLEQFSIRSTYFKNKFCPIQSIYVYMAYVRLIRQFCDIGDINWVIKWN